MRALRQYCARMKRYAGLLAVLYVVQAGVGVVLGFAYALWLLYG